MIRKESKNKMHLKRIAMPKTWPIKRKNKKYVIVPKTTYPLKYSIPLLALLRDLLKISDNSREIKKVIKNKEIEVNGKIIMDEKFGVGLLDIIHIKKINKSFILLINKNSYLILKEIKDDKTKIAKIIGKRTLKGGIQQINLFGGKNFILKDSKEKFKVNDSIIIDLKSNKILEHLPLKENSIVFIIGGRWVGEIAEVISIKGAFIEAKLVNLKKNIKIPKKNIIVINKEKW